MRILLLLLVLGLGYAAYYESTLEQKNAADFVKKRADFQDSLTPVLTENQALQTEKNGSSPDVATLQEQLAREVGSAPATNSAAAPVGH
jgi:hypothetical protein